MIYILDSGLGAYNVKSHLIDLYGTKMDKKVDVILLDKHIGDSSFNEIHKLFYTTIRDKNIKKSDIYMGCNSLNSVLPNFKGVFIQLIKYIQQNKNKKLLILCTNITATELNKFNFNNITLMNLDKNIVKKIDSGIIPNISLNTDLFDEIVLGCTHYDLMNINTNLDIISTSKLGAMELKGLMDLKNKKDGV